MSSATLSVRHTTFCSWVAVAFLFAAGPRLGPPVDVPLVQSGQFVQAELADWLAGFSNGVYVEGSELRLQDGQTAGTYESQPFQAAFGVNAAVLQWHAQVAEGQTLTFELRWSVDGQTWNNWQVARGRSSMDGGAISQMLVLPPFTSWMQYRVRFETATTSPTLADITVTYLDTTAGAASSAIATRIAAIGPAALTSAPPTIGIVDSGLQGLVGDIVRQTPRRILLSSVDVPMDDPNSAATIRALQWVNVNLEQRAGLPFHFIVDGAGRIFQGPGSATAVLPDVAEGTVAVAMLANVETGGLGETMPVALGGLLGWLVDAYGLSPNEVDVAPDAPAQLRDALAGLRATTDRSVVRSRLHFAAGNTALGTERLVLFNQGDDEARATLAVLSPLSPERPSIIVPPGQRVEVPLNATVPINGPLGIEVLSDRPIEVERTQITGREIAGGPPPGDAVRFWYFAEGSSADGDVTTLDILNPHERDVEAIVSLIPDGGTLVSRNLTLGARTQQSVLLNDILPGQRFAITLVASEPVVAERTTLTSAGAAAIAPGIATLERRWLFAEGSTLAGYRTTLALFNPWPQQIGVTLRVLSEDGTSLDRQYTVDGQSRRIVALNDIAPDLPFAMEVLAERPVAVERIITFDEGRGMTIGAGATRTATQWTFAEGSTAFPTEEYLLIVNPHGQPVAIEVTYVLSGGQIERRQHEVGAGARLTIAANAHVPDQPAVSAIITADRPIAAERTMYINTFEGRGGDTSLGVPAD